MKKFFRLSRQDKTFYTINFIVLTLFFLIVLYPCLFVLSASFSSASAVAGGRVYLLPVDIGLDGYKIVFNTKDVLVGFRNSLFYTVVGTALNVTLTMMAAYAMSRKDLPLRGGIMLFFTFTMFFGGGMIPTYILVQKLGMIDTVWSLILPGAIGVYNMVVAKTFIQTNIPDELLEASQLDGCSDIRYFTNVVIPLSKASIAVLVLFYGVGHWNSYFNAMIYLHSKRLYPLTIFLKQILMADQIDPATVTDPELQAQLAQAAGVIKYSLIVVSMVPILAIYPFIQKYFVKGVMVGSIKG